MEIIDFQGRVGDVFYGVSPGTQKLQRAVVGVPVSKQFKSSENGYVNLSGGEGRILELLLRNRKKQGKKSKNNGRSFSRHNLVIGIGVTNTTLTPYLVKLKSRFNGGGESEGSRIFEFFSDGRRPAKYSLIEGNVSSDYVETLRNADRMFGLRSDSVLDFTEKGCYGRFGDVYYFEGVGEDWERVEMALVGIPSDKQRSDVSIEKGFIPLAEYEGRLMMHLLRNRGNTFTIRDLAETMETDVNLGYDEDSVTTSLDSLKARFDNSQYFDLVYKSGSPSSYGLVERALTGIDRGYVGGLRANDSSLGLNHHAVFDFTEAA